ncbi:MAG: hypothetical protein GAK43_00306 [Stenotrophomonas maltophilia]|nr:MAG: hypothetical protein GAK43_00306 [Stenotrophomonas maltophilia]
MSDIQRERELRRLEASLGVDKSVDGESSPASKIIVPEPVEHAKPVLKKVAVVSEQINNQTIAIADEALKRLPNITLSRTRRKSLYICVGAALLVGAGVLALKLMGDEKVSAAPAVVIAPSQGLYIPLANNQVPVLPGRVQDEERKPFEHSEQAIPQGLPLMEEAAPPEPVQPIVSSVGEDRGSAESITPAQTITPAPAVAPRVRPVKNESEAKVARPPAVVASPRVIQRYQPPSASDKEIKAEVERVEAGKPWQSKIDQIKELDL